MSVVLLSSIQGYSQQATPTEKTTIRIVRDQSSGVEFIDKFLRNVYKTELVCQRYETKRVSYQDTEYYTVTVPYQDTEYWTERIPYQDTEYYTERIPYQDTEYYTVSVPYQVQESYQETVTDYVDREKCDPATTKQECHMEHKCWITPGGEQCGDQKVCREVQVPPRCYIVKVPKTYTVTKYRTVTRYRDEQRSRTVTRYREVERSRTVTRYREVTHSRQVTKYRDEQRSRQVTKYRDEQVCVDSKNVTTVNQVNVPVRIIFPRNSTLLANEKDDLILKGTWGQSAADGMNVVIASKQSKYAYEIEDVVKTQNGMAIYLKFPGSEPHKPQPVKSADLMILKDENQLNGTLSGAAIDSLLTVTDLTREYSDVKTEYWIYVMIYKNNQWQDVNYKMITRTQFKSQNMMIKLKDVIQSTSQSQSVLYAGNNIAVSIIAKRTGPSSLFGGQAVKARKVVQFTIK